MLFFVCALFCEAEPIIAHYGLKKLARQTLFPIYKNQDIYLIISSVGKINAAACISVLYQIAEESKNQVWLNVGVAGHPFFSIGSSFLANKIIDFSTKQAFFPMWTSKKRIESCLLTTVDIAERSYPSETLYDMEASGFYQMAKKVSTIELIHCYKIVSDNLNHPATFSKEFVKNLVKQNMVKIEQVASELQNSVQNFFDPEIECFCQKWHFTETQKIQLKDRLKNWYACNKNLFDIRTIPASLHQAGEVIVFLDKQINQTSLIF